MKRVQATQEVLGIYLSCLQPTLAYNLPTLIPVGKRGEEEVVGALKKVMEAHPHLNDRFQLDKNRNQKDEIQRCQDHILK
jgi:hypothetical protein